MRQGLGEPSTHIASSAHAVLDRHAPVVGPGQEESRQAALDMADHGLHSGTWRHPAITAEDHWYFLLTPLATLSIVGPIIDVTGRMTGLQQNPAVRTRLMSLYVGMMFTGAGLGSWSGTLAYDRGGWLAVASLLLGFSAVVWLLSLQQWLRLRTREGT